MTAAEVIARRLHAAGCRHAFGIPGGEVLAMMDALARAGIAFHLARHENAAGFMAEGTWHATGAPGILLATLGPGILNAVNVAANALQDRVPLVLISGAVDAAEALRYTHQVLDHTAVFAPVTKAAIRVPAGAAAESVDKALAIALSGRPGPVLLDLPIAVATAPEEGAGAPLRGPMPPAVPAPGPALEAARAMFRAARRPLVVAGLDVLSEPGGPEAVRTFVERHAIPLVTTYKAKGVLPEDHPLALGGHGLSPKADAIVLPLVGAADLVISAGYDPGEMRAGWRDPWDPAKAVEFAHAPNTHGMHYARHAWVSSVAGGLAALEAGAEPKAGWPDDAPARTRAALDAAFAPAPGWGPARAIAELAAALPPEATVTVDSGAHRILLSQMWRASRPRALLQSTVFCTMGCALPLALGFKTARPQAPVVAVTGDGGLEMVLGELATVRDSGLPLVVVVLVDASLGLIELKQRRSGLAGVGVDFGHTDFVALAAAYGGRGVRVEGPGEVGPAVGEALAADRFTVVAVEIPRRAYDGLF